MPEISDADLAALNAAKAEGEKHKKELEELKAKAPPPPPPAPKKKAGEEGEGDDDPEDDLDDKVRKSKKSSDESKAEVARMESAVSFNLSLKDFLEANKDALPEEIAEIVAAAEKEKYDTAVEKANEIRVGVIKSFFDVQENLDLLTDKQKTTLENYLKLTQNGRRDRAESIYETLFEPTFESMKKIRKAQEVGRSRSGLSSGTKTEDAYKQRLIDGARQIYLGQKKGD